MSKRTYYPERGDLIEINFFPSAGREIDKRRPAIVLSDARYNRQTGLCLAVPTSTDLTPGPFWIAMPDGYLPSPSLILCDYIKSFDWRDRSARFLHKLPDDLVDQIVETAMDIIDPR